MDHKRNFSLEETQNKLYKRFINNLNDKNEKIKKTSRNKFIKLKRLAKNRITTVIFKNHKTT